MFAAGEARAQTVAPVTRNDFALEFFQGPVLAPQRVTSLGGAYIASAEGVEGAAVNSASPSVRDPFSLKWLDYDVGLGLQLPGAFAATDFDNRGAGGGTVGDFVALDFGLQMQFGHLGVCATGDLQQYEISPTSGAAGLSIQFGRWKGLASYGAFGGQLHLGSGIRAVSMQVNQNGAGGGTLLTMTGAAPELGALLMPDGSQWRLGTTFRFGVSGKIFGSDKSTNTDGVRRAGNVILPTEVALPWELEAGVAYQVGPRPLNPPWLNPHTQERALRDRLTVAREARARELEVAVAAAPLAKREALRKKLEGENEAVSVIEELHLEAEKARLLKVRRARYANWPREKILLLASVLMTGASDDSVSLQSFLDQRRELVGRVVSFTPRLGIEGEPIVGRLRARVGTYLEPSRYETGTARQHFTFGGDLRLFDFNAWGLVADTTWRLSLFVDLAPRYTNGGISIGAWH